MLTPEELVHECQKDHSLIPQAIDIVKAEVRQGKFDSLLAFKMAGYEDMALFSKFFLPDMVPYSVAPHHHDFYDSYKSGNGERLLNVIFPRGTGKTTVAVKVTAIHGAVYCNIEGWKNRDLKNMVGSPLTVITSASAAHAERVLGAIKWQLESNDLLNIAFAPSWNLNENGRPSLRVKSDKSTFKWNEGEIVLANGAQINAIGSGGQVRGINNFLNFRVTLFIGDDMEGTRNTTNINIINNTRHWFREEVMPTLFKEPIYEGRIIIVGTVVHEQCLVNHLKHKNKQFVTLFEQLIVDEGTKDERSIWPEMVPLASAKKDRAAWEADGYLTSWLQEYMNVARSHAERPFAEDGVRYYDGEFKFDKETETPWLAIQRAYDHEGIPLTISEVVPVSVTLGVDLATGGGSQNDFTVVIAVGTDANSNVFVIDYIRQRITSPTQQVAAVFDFVKKYHPQAAVVETIGYQLAFPSLLREEMSRKNAWFRIIPEKHREQMAKEDRIPMTLEPRMTAGAYFQKKVGMHELFRELTEFPQGDHDDLPDALQMAVKHSRRCTYTELPQPQYLDRDEDEMEEPDSLVTA